MMGFEPYTSASGVRPTSSAPESKLSKLVVAPLLVLIALAVMMPAFGGKTAATQQAVSDQRFLEKVARENNIPSARLKLGDRVTRHYPLTGVHVTVIKVVDQTTAKTYRVAVDAQGRFAEPAAAAAAEERARLERFGKIDPPLFAKLAGLKADDPPLPVSIWLNIPDPPLRREKTTDNGSRRREAARDAELSRYMAPRRSGVVDALRRMSARPGVPKYAPAVFADLRRGQIEAIARHPDVTMVYGSDELFETMDDAGTTEKVNTVWDAGNLGSAAAQGGMIQPIQWANGGVSNTNPFLHNDTHHVTFWNSANPNIGNHATQVAGIIASTHVQYQGIAPHVQRILSANWGAVGSPDNEDRVAAYEWAHDRGGDPVNLSYGGSPGAQTFLSRYIDWATRVLQDTFVVAAGNGGDNENKAVTAPATAWSAISVGAIGDNNNGFWSDDTMMEFSSWVNPSFAPEMEKPEVVAVGANVKTTDSKGGDHVSGSWSGTSFAAPQVAGQVALLLARRPGQQAWPETNKAAVLASAWHDIEPGQARDGVGAIVIDDSDDTYRLSRYINDCNALCAPLLPGDFPRVFNDAMRLNKGDVVRVAIAWDSFSTGDGFDKLGANLALELLGPNNFSIISDTAENAWEMVEFTAPADGYYHVKVTGKDFEMNWPGTYLGIAWSIKSVPSFCEHAAFPAVNGIAQVNTLHGVTFFDSYAGWAGANQKGRERLLKFTLPATQDVTVTINNNNLSLHVFQLPPAEVCANDSFVPQMKGQANNVVVLNDLPAGTYYVAVDGPNLNVGNALVTVQTSGP